MALSNSDGNLKPLLVPTSPGQVLDRLTILQIKAVKTVGRPSHAKVIAELAELQRCWEAAVTASPELTHLESELRRVNTQLWDVEDRLRLYEFKSEFGPEFVGAARSVYRLNDERFRLKCSVDELLRCTMSETKLYAASLPSPH